MADLDPTRPIETTPDGLLVMPIYGQDGKFVFLNAKDTPHNRRFVVWLRKFDRYGKGAGE